MKKILVPVASEGLDAATLGLVKEFAVKMGAQLKVVTVLPESEFLTHQHLGNYMGVVGKAFNDVCEETISKAVKQLADEGVENVSTAILEGDPAAVIIDYAEKEKCDLILIHSHGMGAIKRFTTGSVTNTVLHHAAVSVLVVK